jgi:hypothetical protein
MSTSNTFATAEALRIVLREEQPAGVAEVLLDMERARMAAEDYRGAMMSPYPAGTWKEACKERHQRYTHVTVNVIEPAEQALDRMCSDLRTKLTAPGSNRQPGYKALETVHNDMCRVLSILREEAFEGDELRCIVCETVSSPDWVNIVPAGTVPEVAPETHIVCGRCYAANPAMGEANSFF